MPLPVVTVVLLRQTNSRKFPARGGCRLWEPYGLEKLGRSARLHDEGRIGDSRAAGTSQFAYPQPESRRGAPACGGQHTRAFSPQDRGDILHYRGRGPDAHRRRNTRRAARRCHRDTAGETAQDLEYGKGNAETALLLRPAV